MSGLHRWDREPASMTRNVLSYAVPRSRLMRIAPLLVAFLVLCAWVAAHFLQARLKSPLHGSFYTVEPIDLNIIITKSAELQAVNNVEIPCPIDGESTIQQIVKEGTFVKKG